MRLAEATVVALDIEPGWRMMADHVNLGDRYIVDLDSVVYMTMENAALGRAKRVAVILVFEPPPPGWLPIDAFGMRAAPEGA